MEEDFEPQELTDKNFDGFVKKGTILIDFYAEWCMPCLMMEPIVNELSEKFAGKVKFGKVNIDDNHTIAQKFNVRSIPNFVLFNNGEVVGQFLGAMSEEDFEKKLRSYM